MGDAGSLAQARSHKIPDKCRFMNHKAKPGQAYVPTEPEHIANITTHALWVLPSFMGLCWMLNAANSKAQIITALVYGGATFTLFCVSTTFHTISYSGKYSSGLREFFHIGDRAVIYIFIAASYTPWLVLRDFDGWSGSWLTAVWLGAVVGIIYQYTFHEKYKWLETLFYVLMGVCPSICVMGMRDQTGIFEMAVGGGVYISGVVFFKCDGRIPFAHAIWHCFVFVGAVFHYIAVCKYLLVIPNGRAPEYVS